VGARQVFQTCTQKPFLIKPPDSASNLLTFDDYFSENITKIFLEIYDGFVRFNNKTAKII